LNHRVTMVHWQCPYPNVPSKVIASYKTIVQPDNSNCW
jgi:hypothetical protein